MQIGLYGYTCRGNFGDLAMGLALAKRFQLWGHNVTVFAFGDDVKDELAFQNANCYVVADTERYTYVDALVIGGGELGPGFGFQLICPAILRDVPVYAYGQSLSPAWIKHPLFAEGLRAYTHVWVRDVESQSRAIALGVDATLCADPVYMLSYPSPPKRKIATVFVRRPGIEHTDTEIRLCINAAITSSRFPVRFAVSARTDVEYVSQFGTVLEPASVHDLMYMIAESQVIYSIGRYHPCVFADMCGVPYASWLCPRAKILNSRGHLESSLEQLRERLC